MSNKEQQVLLKVIQKLSSLLVPGDKKNLQKMEEQEKHTISGLFKKGWSSERVRARYKKYSRQQIAAIKAHVTMGTY
jgi:hypothetical protein